MPKGIDRLIISSPYEEPAQHWEYDRESREFRLAEGRRSAGYVMATPDSEAFDDPGVFVPIELVNLIRPRVRAWREAGYPGVTGTTKRLLEHWRNPEERHFRRFFFCQLEAIETLIWLAEASPSEHVGIKERIGKDGGPFGRLCSKMATGSGKTIVMALAAAWQILNKVSYPQDSRFSKNILIVAPGLTVKSRLQVLYPSEPGNYYDEFNIVPSGLRDKLRQGQVRVLNWHALNWETDEQLSKKKSVDKRGAKSDEAYVREVLGEMANSRNIVVFNDEAHHAWRVPPGTTIRGFSREADPERATKWVGGLDRIHKARGILQCYDFSATPFVPLGRKSAEEWLFKWVVSDFSLNDAIESGLVKTPRVVVRDDGTLSPDYKSRFYHIYNDKDVKDDLNRRGAQPEEPLPPLVTAAFYHLGKDWRETAKRWEGAGHPTPPVMITVANQTETAARVYQAFRRKRIEIPELGEEEGLLHIDSKVLETAEEQAEPVRLNGGQGDSGENSDENSDNGQDEENEKPKTKLTKQQKAEQLRQMVDTVGRVGEAGEKVKNVVSVGMLSEGWDAKTVTHIMGLRAFSSQLLCEQVVGRGLRRTTYEVDSQTGLFEPEYVNIFGVPFSFLPHEGGDGPAPAPPSPKTEIKPVPEKRQFEITWPDIIRVDRIYRPQLTLDTSKLKALVLSRAETPLRSELSPVLSGKTDFRQLTEIDLRELGKTLRLQTAAFKAAAVVFDQIKPGWRGSREALLGQLVRLVEDFLRSGLIEYLEPEVESDPFRQRAMISLNMEKVVEHIWQAIRHVDTEALVPVFNVEKPIRSTEDMLPWRTGKPNEWAERSHINFCVFDSTWEGTEAYELDHSEHVAAWVKNDHLGFELHYRYQGVARKYRPDFLIKLRNGKTLVLEVKGVDSEQNRAKREALDEWVKAVNEDGRFGQWVWDVSRQPMDIGRILEKHGTR